ncbi:hypothetical protein KKE26_03420 [bacterium]|nr:hypothetical protein [bacterium]
MDFVGKDKSPIGRYPAQRQGQALQLRCDRLLCVGIFVAATCQRCSPLWSLIRAGTSPAATPIRG